MKFSGNLFENVENCKFRKKKIGRSWTPHIHFHSHNMIYHIHKNYGKQNYSPFTWIHIQVPLSCIQNKSLGMNGPLNVAHLVLKKSLASSAKYVWICVGILASRATLQKWLKKRRLHTTGTWTEHESSAAIYHQIEPCRLWSEKHNYCRTTIVWL
jgi:hypothetical protein